jgi:hypothetical protein
MIEHPSDGASQLSLVVNVSSPLPQEDRNRMLYWFATSPVEHIELWANAFNRGPRWNSATCEVFSGPVQLKTTGLRLSPRSMELEQEQDRRLVRQLARFWFLSRAGRFPLAATALRPAAANCTFELPGETGEIMTGRLFCGR